MSSPNDQPDDQKDVIANYANEMQQVQMWGYERAVRKARNALFWAGGLTFAGEMVGMFNMPTGFDPLIFVIALIEGGIFVALGFWTKKKPYTAIMTGLIVFIAFIILAIVFKGMEEGAEGVAKGLVSGIIIKIIILVNLIRPIKDAKELQEAKKRTF